MAYKVTLPSRTEMERRLNSVDSGNHSDIAKKLHPKLLTHTNVDLDARGVVSIISLEITAVGMEKHWPLYKIEELIRNLAPKYIKLLVGDRRVRNQALQLISDAPSN